MRSPPTCILFVTAILAPVFAFGFSAQEEGQSVLNLQWVREVVESESQTGAFTSIRIDESTAQPLIAYQDLGNLDLKFAYMEGTRWRTTTVDSVGGTGWLPSLAVGHGRTTISYARLDSTRSIRFAELVNGSWSSIDIWVGGTAGASSTLVGDDGRRHVAFDGGSAGLLLASETPQGWNTTIVDGTILGVNGISATYHRGLAALAYTVSDVSTGKGVAKVAIGNGSGWHFETVANGTGSSISAAFDSRSGLHVAFGRDEQLIHAFRENGTWGEDVIDAGTAAGDIHVHLALTVGGDDQPRVAYLVTDSYRLMYAVRDPGGWLRSEVDRKVGRGLWVSIAVDPWDNPHLAYEDVGFPSVLEDLWHATTRPNSPPKADFSIVSGPEGRATLFDASNSSDPDGDVISYRWDFDGDGAWDTSWSVDPTASHTWGDDWTGSVALEVSDGILTDDETLPVTVTNVDPAIWDARAYVVADVTLRVAGERFHDARMDLLWNGQGAGTVSIVRMPGSPGEQTATIPSAHLHLLGDLRIVLTYTPDDDPINGQGNGANPAWVVLTMPNGSEVRLHHAFNVQHPETWTWTLDDLRPFLVGQDITFEATASDVGSDDLTIAWDFGDGGTARAMYFNDGVGPDPFPSPEVNPITAVDAIAHSYVSAGTYTVTLTVADDDGGTVTTAFTIAVNG